MANATGREQLRRVGLLVFTILHWTLFAIYLWPERTSTWNYSSSSTPQLARIAPPAPSHVLDAGSSAIRF